MSQRDRISTPAAPKAIGPYSQGIRAGGFVFVSGQVPVDPDTGQVVEGGVGKQTERCLTSLAAILAAAGSGLERVVKTTVFMTDLARFAEMNAVYEQFFPQDPPARATVQVVALPRGVAVEIEAVALAG